MDRVDRLLPSFVIPGKAFESETKALVDAFEDRIPAHREALAAAVEAGSVIRDTNIDEVSLLSLVDDVKAMAAEIRTVLRQERAFDDVKAEARAAKEAEFKARRAALLAGYKARSDEIMARGATEQADVVL